MGRDMGYLGQKLLATAMTDERDCWQFYPWILQLLHVKVESTRGNERNKTTKTAQYLFIVRIETHWVGRVDRGNRETATAADNSEDLDLLSQLFWG